MSDHNDDKKNEDEKLSGSKGGTDQSSKETENGLDALKKYAEEIGDDGDDDFDIELTPLSEDDAEDVVGGLEVSATEDAADGFDDLVADDDGFDLPGLPEDEDDELFGDDDDVAYGDDESEDITAGTAPEVTARKAKQKKDSVGKLVAPLAVLLVAGGVGGYIVMNPDLIGGGTSSAPVAATSTMASTQQPVRIAPKLVAEEPAPAMFDESLPEADDEADDSVAVDAVMPRAPDGGDDDFFFEPEAPVENNMAENESDGEEPSLPDFGDEPEMLVDDSAAMPEEAVLAEEPSADLPAVVEAVNDVPEPSAASLVEPSASAGGAQGDSIEFPDEMPFEDEKQAEAQQLYETSFSGESRDKTAVGQSAPVKRKTGPDSYFDAASQVSVGATATEIGPRKVNPSLEPAQKYVVVKKTSNEDDPEALLVSANRALKLKRYDAAVDMFEKLHDLNDRDPRILMGRAVALQHAGRPEAAMVAYEDLLAVAPDNREAVVNLLGLLRTQYPSVALRRLITLRDQFPNDDMIAAQLGVTHADLGHYAESVSALSVAMSLAPQNAQHVMNMAIIEDRQGHKGKAVKYYEQALQVDAIYGNGRSIPREVIYDRLAKLRR